MSNLPITYALGIFLLGFLAGIITTSLIYEFRRRPEQENQETDRVEQITERRTAAEQSGTQPVLPTAGASPVNAADTRSAIQQPGQLPPGSAPQEPVQWIPGPIETRLEKVSPNPLEALVRSVQSSNVKEAPKNMSMAEEIDEILQEMLNQSELRGRIIRLRSLPDQSVEVIVDGAKYGGVAEVSDSAARALIQNAVAAWQHRANLKDKK